MKVDTAKRSVTVRNLIILQFLLGLGAAISGGLLVLGPDGHLMQMPLLMLSTTPFTTFLLPGILLFFFVGIFPLVVAYSLFARPSWTWPNLVNPFRQMHWAWAASLAAGVAVIAWISVQMLMFGSVNILHVIYLGWGAAIILLTLSPAARRSYLQKL